MIAALSFALVLTSFAIGFNTACWLFPWITRIRQRRDTMRRLKQPPTQTYAMKDGRGLYIGVRRIEDTVQNRGQLFPKDKTKR